jgi:[protein-PII] uridylyltransferase
MQRYYRTVMDLSRLNEMLLQLFEEEILMDPRADPISINQRFQVKNGYLQTRNDQVFAHTCYNKTRRFAASVRTPWD